GAALVVEGASTLADPGASGLAAAVRAPAAVLGGGALALGLFTPAAAALATIVGLARAGAGGGLAAILVVVIAAAVILLGPGAFSVDARLFGRREIVVPRSTHRSAD